MIKIMTFWTKSRSKKVKSFNFKINGILEDKNEIKDYAPEKQWLLIIINDKGTNPSYDYGLIL